MTDPITLALFQNRLDYVARQMGWVMIRTSRSPIFNQSHDFSCFVADGDGNLVSQADGIPIHTGGGGFAVRALLEAFGDDMADGDVFVLNDPLRRRGATTCPIGSSPGRYSSSRSWWRSRATAPISRTSAAARPGRTTPRRRRSGTRGFACPPCASSNGGETREDLWRLLILNSRMPHFMDGDLRAMIGSTGIGRGLVVETMERFGLEEGRRCFAGVLDHGDALMREAISRLPDGAYEAESGFDDDCFDDMELPIRVGIVISGDEMTVDFTGTADQIRGFKNSSLANTYSSRVLGAFHLLRPLDSPERGHVPRRHRRRARRFARQRPSARPHDHVYRISGAADHPRHLAGPRPGGPVPGLRRAGA